MSARQRLTEPSSTPGVREDAPHTDPRPTRLSEPLRPETVAAIRLETDYEHWLDNH